MIVERNLFKHERVREIWGLECYERKILSFYTLEIYELWRTEECILYHPSLLTKTKMCVCVRTRVYAVFFLWFYSLCFILPRPQNIDTSDITSTLKGSISSQHGVIPLSTFAAQQVRNALIACYLIPLLPPCFVPIFPPSHFPRLYFLLPLSHTHQFWVPLSHFTYTRSQPVKGQQHRLSPFVVSSVSVTNTALITWPFCRCVVVRSSSLSEMTYKNKKLDKT